MVDALIDDPPSGPVAGLAGVVRFEAGVLTLEVTGRSPLAYTLVTRALDAAIEAHPTGVRVDAVLTREVDTWTCTGSVRETTVDAGIWAAKLLHRQGCRVTS